MDKYIDQLSQLMDKLFLQYKHKISDKIGVLVSGGIDSSIIAYYCQKYFPQQTILFSFGSSTSKDKPYVNLLQKHLKLPVYYLTITQESVNAVVPTVKHILQQLSVSNFNPPAGGQILNSLTHTSLAVGYYLIFQEITKHQIKIVFTGQGTDVLMAGYNKYKKLLINNYQILGNTIKLSETYDAINKTIINDLSALEIDKVRDNSMAFYHKLNLINPYLDLDFVNLCLKIPVNYKLHISDNTLVEKYIERLWGKSLDLPDEIVWRPKMAFQYSTQVQKLVQKTV